jgi:hypothetical protein
MRGTVVRQAMMLTAVTPDALVPERHPIVPRELHDDRGHEPLPLRLTAPPSKA